MAFYRSVGGRWVALKVEIERMEKARLDGAWSKIGQWEVSLPMVFTPNTAEFTTLNGLV